ncbi:MAG: 16S rRNA (cytidine(1402)-2'-O)-methyltransferase [Oscillospiraceae bacterium]|jgi:16S rRNA (cytidine1402-2'-O)-methyltransferase|nr:16S rRNA (cytidine(1402)-2'-O)-methyltransferase [Oscillospiraceae bacterium]
MLYIVAVPIGNADDLSPRAAETLRTADLILCEDTRTSFPLLKRHGIETPLKSYHKFNERERAEDIAELLRGGSNIALISDAGTPCVSDPGAVLTAAAVAEGVSVSAVPGPCAAIAALSISGFNAASFVFRGFLPRKKGQLAKVISTTLTEPSPVTIFYESPLRIITSAACMADEIPDSRVCLCNDLTKPHERVYRGTPKQILEELQANRNASKGEYTIVIARSVIKPISGDCGNYERKRYDKDQTYPRFHRRDRALGYKTEF